MDVVARGARDDHLVTGGRGESRRRERVAHLCLFTYVGFGLHSLAWVVGRGLSRRSGERVAWEPRPIGLRKGCGRRHAACVEFT